jgi:hypothetical protein
VARYREQQWSQQDELEDPVFPQEIGSQGKVLDILLAHPQTE